MPQFSSLKNIRIVFVFSDGRKHVLNRKYYKELSRIFPWLDSRSDEFQKDIEFIKETGTHTKLSILEIHSSGEKKILINMNPEEYKW